MTSPVITLGLDSADPEMIEDMIAKGKLPNIAALYQGGKYSRLDNYNWYRAETPWTTFLTGTSPQKTGYWSPIKYDPEKYQSYKINAFNFDEYPPFYASMEGKKVAVFDMPQAPIADNVDGVQVLAWGTHSGQTPSISSPKDLWQSIVDKHGEHPLLNKDGANCYDIESLKKLAEKMKVGIQRRADVCIDLISSGKWDYFLTIFGEAHVAGHYFWHLGAEHPLREYFDSIDAPDLLEESFVEIDKAIGRIIEACPRDATIVVFSAHGMGPNTMDLPSVAFLAEFLYRWNFPGKQAIAPGKMGEPVVDIPVEEMKTINMAPKLWQLTREGKPIRDLLKNALNYKWYRKLERRLPQAEGREQAVMDPFRLKKLGFDEPFQCSNWFSGLWPQMKAFALPSFSEGYVRINLKGRDKYGIVDPEDYESVCDEICEELSKLVDSRTGTPMVLQTIRTRPSLKDETEKSPDADIVVVWQEESVASAIESPTIGRIGPVPYWRTGSHRAGGFFIISGPEVSNYSLRNDGHAIDIGATFLQLLGCPIPQKNEGSSLVVEAKTEGNLRAAGN